MIALLKTVFLIHRSGFRADHTRTEQRCKPDMRQIAVRILCKACRIRIGEIQVASKHCHIQLILCKNLL